MNIKIYIADTSELEDTELFWHFYTRASSARREKADRMKFCKDKRLSLGAGVLLEAALAAEGVSDFTMTMEHNKKPCLLHGDVKFNISHSGTKVMCAVSDCDIGCDVEQITDIDMEIARQFFFAGEYEALMKCRDEKRRRDLFFRYWTLKESFMKATGLGFELPLDKFCIMIDGGGISVRQNIDKRAYYFREFLLYDGYRYAVCSVEKPINKGDACIIRYPSFRNL